MAITRLSGGLTPGDGSDPRTFPAIWNATATDLENTQATLVSTQSTVVSQGSAISTLQTEMNNVQRDVAGVLVAGSNSVTVDFSTETPLISRTASSGTVTITASNYAEGVTRTIRIVAGTATAPLSIPAGWVFVGNAAGTVIAANKTAIITATSFGTAASNVVAAYAVQA